MRVAGCIGLAFADGRAFHVIGTDGGLLERAVPVTGLDLGPGQRVELLVDLTRDSVGTSILLKSLAFAVPGAVGPARSRASTCSIATTSSTRTRG